MEKNRRVLLYINEHEKLKDCIGPYYNGIYRNGDEIELMSIIDTETLDYSSIVCLVNNKNKMLQNEIKKREKMLIKAKKIFTEKFKKRNVDIKIKMNVLFSSNVSYSKNLAVFARDNGISLIVVGGECFDPADILHWNNRYVRIEQVDQFTINALTMAKY